MKKLLLILLFAAHVWGITCSSSPSSYGYYKKITIDHTKIPNTNQTAFPVLISFTSDTLKSVGNGGCVQSTSGFDIVVSGDTGATSLHKWNMERYNPATGEVILWTKTTLSYQTDSVFYILYNNGSISTFQGDSANAWPTSILAGYHLSNGTTLSGADFTGSKNGTLVNSPIAYPGQIDGAMYTIATSSQWLKAPKILESATNASISGWMYDSLVTYAAHVSVGNTGSANRQFGFERAGSNVYFIARDGSGANYSFVSSAVITGWNHYVFSYDGAASGNTKVKGYINGTAQTLTYSGTQPATLSSSLDSILIGKWDDGTYSRAGFDKVWFYNVTLSADWIKTEYNNQSSPSTFYSTGPQMCASNCGGAGVAITSINGAPIANITTVNGATKSQIITVNGATK